MSYRKHQLVVDQIYHVFNRSVARLPIFVRKDDCQRALEVINFYSYNKPLLRYSHYKRMQQEARKDFLGHMRESLKKQVEIFAFCLMPTHFHFELKETIEGGIVNFMKNFQDSYAKYFNLKHDSIGSVFQNRFKAIRMETDEQFLHVNRYIHLNPLTGYLIKDPEELEGYHWCSFGYYLNKTNVDFVNTEFAHRFFKNNIEKFKAFTFDQVEYQRTLAKIKHLVFE